MTDTGTGVAQPSIGDLVNWGVDYAKTAKAAIPYFAAMLAALILPRLLGSAVGGILGAICGVGMIFIAVMASREAITGEFAYKDGDPMVVAKLFGLSVLMVFAMFVLAAILMGLFGAVSGSRGGFLFLSLVAVIVAVVVFARLAFVLPAWAMNDPASLKGIYEQTAPHWITLILLFVVTALPNLIFDALFGGLGGFFGGLMTLIGAAVSVAIGLVAIGAVARLYARRARAAAA